ncbi:hypothetical protein TNCV_3758921 [Trichonephila clavipes]|nr:hypothetical protein TNCV_3758921 [Trichonephila clavipes]
MREKGGDHLMPGLDYMVDVLKPPNETPRVSASHYRRVWPGVVLMEHNTSFGQFWPFLSHQIHNQTILAVIPGLATV